MGFHPPTIFVDSDGNVQAVHTGFTGSATGRAAVKLRAEFESILWRMLE